MLEGRELLTIETSWDDGHLLDLKLANLLLKYEIPGTFYIPNTCELSYDQIRLLAKDFEIGGHTVSHPQDIKLLRDEDIRDQVFSNKMWLENIIGKKIERFCYPRGRHNEIVRKIVQEAGYTYARTTRVLDIFPPKDDFQTNTTIHLYPRHEYQGKYMLEVFDEQMRLAVSFMKKEPVILHVWGHSWEIEKLGLWVELEEMLKKMQRLCQRDQ